MKSFTKKSFNEQLSNTGDSSERTFYDIKMKMHQVFKLLAACHPRIENYQRDRSAIPKGYLTPCNAPFRSDFFKRLTQKKKHG
ncbi:hypothetical protein OUZ56_030135 [Daphnia magna]|uniref:Uncharacterized protein n=1 Tax=Daphnia magna TaxID=35525 RepID=A0ABQ9ZQF9_9CRUS|nr:hypothetical protein OUZ56_030135 [Daphnia magna]